MFSCCLENMEERPHPSRVIDIGQPLNVSAVGTIRTALEGSRPVQSEHWERSREGFSLVEIVLALGIVSVALVALLGLLPVGIQTFETAIDGTTYAQISQTIIGHARQAKFADLSKLAARTFHFDGQGNLILDNRGEPANDPNFVYEAAIRINYEQDLPLRNSPNGSPNFYETANLAVITMKIVKVSDPKHPFVSTAYVSNCGL